MKKVLISGNPKEGLAYSLAKVFPQGEFVSRHNDFELTQKKCQLQLAEKCLNYDVFVNNSALWKFQQTVLLDAIYKKCAERSHNIHIVCVGSTTDRVKKGGAWLYNAEKKALRDYCNTLAINGVWSKGPKISLISFGTLTNNQEKHPDRKCLDIDKAAQYIKWLVDQPLDININEISIDPMQGEHWYE